MNIPILTLSFAAALVLAGVMGFAIQRGATCTVAAVEQIIVERRTQRVQSLLLASACVLAGLLLAHALGFRMDLPGGYALGIDTVAGGALLGLGAFVNQSCVFGSIAKLGSGQWSYLMTPLGYLMGCAVSVEGAQARHVQSSIHHMSSASTSLLVAIPLVAFLLWLALRWSRPAGGMFPSLRTHLHHVFSRRVWEPGAATMVIGITFLGMWLLVGAWSYTDLLAELARGLPTDIAARSLLFLALFGGAILGGWSAGRLHAKAFSPSKWLRCLGGGVLMGIGSTLIPGSNDGLLLVGMPLFWGYAWSAVAAMALTIGIAILVQRRMLRGVATGPA